MLRATKIVEETGRPAFTIVADGFVEMARVTGRAIGVPDAWLLEYPGHPATDAPEELRAKVREVIVPSLLEGLARARETRSGDGPAPEAADTARAIVCRGSLDEVLDRFHREAWSDGLPFVPPTPQRVQRFLDWVERDPDELVADGAIPPEFREPSIWAIAVNGVMAGCRPEYMPLLVAIAEAVSDPAFDLKDLGHTPGSEHVVVVSGPFADALEFNHGVGLLRAGRQANASVGRFLRLFLRNVAGLRPGHLDKGAIGLPTNVAIAEDEAAATEIGWPPFRCDQGFGLDDTTVTVQSALQISQPIYVAGTTGEELAEMLCHYLELTCGPFVFGGVNHHKWYPLLIVGPTIARAFAAAGWDKDRIRQHLYDTTTVDAWWFERYQQHVQQAVLTLEQMRAAGMVDDRYVASDDPHRRIPLLLEPDWTNVVVAGDAARNQCKIVLNGVFGPPQTRRVEPPGDWRTRLGSTGGGGAP